MASLTNTGDGLTTGKRVIGPPDLNQGFLGGLAKAGSALTGAFASNYAESNQIEGNAALNETERGVTKLRLAAEAAVRSPVDQQDYSNYLDESGVGPDLKSQKLALDKTRRGIEQGRTATTQLELQLEQFQQTIETKYPDQAAKIGMYMKSQGYDHYMWSGANDALAAEDSDRQATNSGRAAVIQKGTEMGLNPDGSFSADQVFHITSEVLVAQTKMGIAKLSQEAALAAAKESREAGTFAEHKSDRDMYSYGSALISSQLTPIYTTFSNLVDAAGTNEDAWARLEKTGGEITQYGTQLKNSLRNTLQRQGASREIVDSVMADADGQIKAMQDLMSGPTSQIQQNKRSMDMLQSQFGLKIDKALPMLKFFKETIGPGFVDAVFGGDPTHMFSPELMGKLKSEMMSYDPTKPNTGFKILQDIGAMTKGNLNLADLPESYVTGDHVRGLVASSSGAAKRVLSQASNFDDGKEFLNSTGNVVIAASTLQPGNKDLKAQEYAINAITSNVSVSALDKLMKDQNLKGQAGPLFMATRAAATNVLEVAKTAGPKDVAGQKLVIKNGQWAVQMDPRRTVVNNALSFANPAMGQNDIQGFEQNLSANKSPELQRQADILNRAVDYLVNTRGADKAVAGVDPTVLRSHYMTGTALPAKEGETAAAPNWQNTLSQFEQDLSRRGKELDKQFPVGQFNPNQTQWEPVANQAASAAGVKPQALAWLLEHESHWDPNIGGTKIDNNKDGKPDSSASGIGQFTVGTGKRFGLIDDAGDHRGDANKAIPAAAQYLAELVKQHGGDYIKALHSYGTLARSNFKSDAEYQAAVASARNAIGD